MNARTENAVEKVCANLAQRPSLCTICTPRLRLPLSGPLGKVQPQISTCDGAERLSQRSVAHLYQGGVEAHSEIHPYKQSRRRCGATTQVHNKAKCVE